MNNYFALITKLKSILVDDKQQLFSDNITDYVQQIEQAIATKCLPINLLVFLPEHLSLFLNSWLGNDADIVANTLFRSKYKTLSINNENNGLKINGKQHAFANSHELKQLLLGVTDQDELSIAFSNIDGLSPVKFNIANINLLSNLDAAYYTKLAHHSPLGITIATENHTLNQTDLGALNQFSQAISYYSAWVLEKITDDSGHSWLSSPLPSSLKVIPACRVGGNRPLPSLLAEPNNQYREHTTKCAIYHALENGLNAIESLLEGYDTELNSRLILANFEFSDAESNPQEVKDKELHKLLESTQEQLKNIDKELKKSSKERLTGRGLYFQLVEAELSSLDAGCIDKEEINKSHTLSINAEIFEHIKTNLWQKTKDQCVKSNVKVITAIKRTVTTFSEKVNQPERTLILSELDNCEKELALTSFKDHFEIKPKYRGERPVRSFLKRLGEGRKAMFMILMSLSIFGSMVGFNYRDYSFMGAIFLLIFMGAFFYTYSSWKRDDEIAIEKEVDKLREQLHTDFIRVIGDVERENSREVTEQMRGIKEVLQKRLQGQMKSNQEKLKENLKDQKRLLSEKEYLIKNSLTENASVKSTVSTLKETLSGYYHTEVDESDLSFQ